MSLPESLFGLFLVQLALGMVAFLPLLGVVGTGFARFVSLLALAMLGGVCAVQLQLEGAIEHDALAIVVLAAALVVYQGLLSVAGPRVFRATTLVLGASALVAGGAYFAAYLVGDTSGNDALRLAGLFGTLLCLGAVMVAMILGHWYLVNFDLALTPFRTMGWALVGALVLRLALSLAAIPVLAATVPGVSGVEDFAMRHAFELLPRVLFGQVVPIAFAAMTLHTIGLGNKQAATGLLYATIIPILIGETMANVVFLLTRVPV